MRHHKTAATNITGTGVYNSQCQLRGNCRINSVATFF